MIRLIAILVGLGFSGVALISLLFGLGPAFSTLAEHGRFVAPSAEHEFYEKSHAPDGGFSFAGPLGRWDEAQLQRGYQVYKEVCAACHGLQYVSFRDLAQLGYTEGQVKALAAEWTVPGVDPDTGEATTRPGVPTDSFPSPYPNNIAAAAANNNAIPPDLSLITKARGNGSEYVYSLLTGYSAPPAEIATRFPEFDVSSGLHYNRFYKTLALAMAPPIVADGQVTYADGGPEPTIQQMSEDVAAFLTWTAEPKMQERRQTGIAVIVFLIFATVLAYLSKKQIWSAVKPRRED